MKKFYWRAEIKA